MKIEKKLCMIKNFNEHTHVHNHRLGIQLKESNNYLQKKSSYDNF